MPISLHASRTMISRLRARPGARTFVAVVVSSIIALAGGAPVALAQSESASCGEPGNRFTRLVGGSYVSRAQFCDAERRLEAQQEATRDAEIRAGGLIGERDKGLARIAELEAQIAATGTCRAPELEATLEEARAENRELLSDHDSLTSQIAGLDLQIEQLRGTINAQQTQLDSSLTHEEGMSADIIGLRAALKAVETESMALRTENDGLRTAYDDLGQQSHMDASGLSAELDEKAGALNRCQADFDLYRTTVSTAASASGDVQEKLVLATAETEDLQAKLANQSEAHMALETELKVRNDTLVAQDAMIADLRAQLAQVRATAETEAAALKDSLDLNMKQASKVPELTGQVDAQAARIAVLEADLSALRAQSAENDTRLTGFQALAGKQDTDLSRTQSALAAALASRAIVDGKLRDATNSLRSTNALFAKSEKELKVLKANLAAAPDAHKSIEDLKAQLDAATKNQSAAGELLAQLAAAQLEIDVLRLSANKGGSESGSSRALNATLRKWMENSRDSEDSGLFLNDNRLVLSSGASLFQPGSARLSTKGRDMLASMAFDLQSEIASLPSDEDWRLDILGHADATPAGSRWPSNWELSAFRAATVVRELVEAGLPAERLSAVGMGEFHPLVTDTTPEAYAKNRRIELQFR